MGEARTVISCIECTYDAPSVTICSSSERWLLSCRIIILDEQGGVFFRLGHDHSIADALHDERAALI